MKLTAELSAYLDFLRFGAAIAVLVGHMDQDGLFMSWCPLVGYGHEAVIIFFVLSGFIIYSTTVSGNRNSVDYIVLRLSRVYSVALPAIIFSTVISLIFSKYFPFNDDNLSNYRPFSFVDFFSSLFFLNELWSNSSQLTLNNPIWSLCYEVWYYIIFWSIFYIKNSYRWFVSLFLIIFSGPAVIALFPIWLMGVWLAKNEITFIHKKLSAWLLFLVSLFIVILINSSEVDIFIKKLLHEHVPGFWRLRSSQRLITDYLIGLAVLTNIMIFPLLSEWFKFFFLKNKKNFQYLAGFSFTIYLFHRPFTQLSGYFFPNYNRSIVHSVFLFIIILLCCWSISFLTEKRLAVWRRFLFGLFQQYSKNKRAPL